MFTGNDGSAWGGGGGGGVGVELGPEGVDGGSDYAGMTVVDPNPTPRGFSVTFL